MRTRRLWAIGALLVGLGWLVTPSPVPIYDGIGVPDEPYRFVERPEGFTETAEPTVGVGSTPVAGGLSVRGLVVTTLEQTAQMSVFVPPRSLAAKGGPIEVRTTPQAATDHPAGKRIQGNVYLLTLTSPAGPVTTTEQIANGSVFLRALDQSAGWVMHYRPLPTGPWQELATQRGGTDSHVSSWKGAGQYALAKAAEKPSGGIPLLAWLLGGGVAVMVLLVVTIRLRSAPE